MNFNVRVNDELIKKVEEQGFNRQDYSHDDMLEILSYGDFDKKYIKLIDKMVDAMTPEDVEALCNSPYAKDVFTNRVFQKFSYVTPEIKSKLLNKCSKLLMYIKHDKIEEYPMAIIRAYENFVQSGNSLDKTIGEVGRNLEDQILRSLSMVTATQELVDYILDTYGKGSPVIFLMHPYNRLRGWHQLLSEENKKAVHAIEYLRLSSNKVQIMDFVEDLDPILSKNRCCYNSVVNYIKDNITIDFKKAFQEFSESPQYIQTGELEKLIDKYNKFKEMLNIQLEPYQAKWDKSKTSQENL